MTLGPGESLDVTTRNTPNMARLSLSAAGRGSLMKLPSTAGVADMQVVVAKDATASVVVIVTIVPLELPPPMTLPKESFGAARDVLLWATVLNNATVGTLAIGRRRAGASRRCRRPRKACARVQELRARRLAAAGRSMRRRSP